MYFVSEASVYRPLKAHDLIKRRKDSRLLVLLLGPLSDLAFESVWCRQIGLALTANLLARSARPGGEVKPSMREWPCL